MALETLKTIELVLESCVNELCSHKWKRPKKSGGARGNRTPDLYNAIVALSQLSYDPFEAG